MRPSPQQRAMHTGLLVFVFKSHVHKARQLIELGNQNFLSVLMSSVYYRRKQDQVMNSSLLLCAYTIFEGIFRPSSSTC